MLYQVSHPRQPQFDQIVFFQDEEVVAASEDVVALGTVVGTVAALEVALVAAVVVEALVETEEAAVVDLVVVVVTVVDLVVVAVTVVVTVVAETLGGESTRLDSFFVQCNAWEMWAAFPGESKLP